MGDVIEFSLCLEGGDFAEVKLPVRGLTMEDVNTLTNLLRVQYDIQAIFDSPRDEMPALFPSPT